MKSFFNVNAKERLALARSFVIIFAIVGGLCECMHLIRET